MVVDLDAGETQEIELSGRLLDPLEPDSAVVFEVYQHGPADLEYDLCGAMEVIVTPREI
ncbi:hypothetical protein ACLMAL_23975 [Nocardia sp. CWNU-33]|uniref:hypothetical protein n=1 Tax=Nocardia sp. CWNU-33 TaxID=3392117 RepID=UPI00398F2FB0